MFPSFRCTRSSRSWMIPICATLVSSANRTIQPSGVSGRWPSTSEWHGTPPAGHRHAPSLGEHSREILREAGYDDAIIEALFASGTSMDGSKVQRTVRETTHE